MERARQPGDVAARARVTDREPHHDGIVDRDRNDRDRRGRVLGEHRGARADGHEHVGCERDQLGQQSRQTFRLALCPAELESEVLPLDIAKLAHALAERIDVVRCVTGSGAAPR